MASLATIRRATEADWPALWPMIQDVSAAGETYPYAMDLTEADGHRFWMEVTTAVYLAENQEGRALGTYYLKPNQPPLGAHVANAGYIVTRDARCQGIGRALAEHSLGAAIDHGFRALQFNLVVESNHAALALYQSIGFHIVGRLPSAFHWKGERYVDAIIMWQTLSSE